MQKYFLVCLCLLSSGAALANITPSRYMIFTDTCGEFGPPHVEPGNSFCTNEEFYDLAALPTSGGELFWFLDGSLNNIISYGSFCTPLDIIGVTTYYVAAIEGDCISEVATVNVTIYPLPDVQIFPPSPILLYPGDSLFLTSSFDSNNLWSPYSENDSLLISAEGEYILTVRDENYCYNSDTAYVEWIDTTTVHGYHPLVFIPNAFTPDGDGVNDVFAVITHDIDFFHLQIFNRWGELVFESTDKEATWQGGYSHYPESTSFVYRMEYGTMLERKQKAGIINLIR